MPKEGSHCIFLSVVLIDFVFKMGKNYYLQVFLKQFKYIVKEKEVARNITEDIKISFDNSDEYDEEKTQVYESMHSVNFSLLYTKKRSSYS